MSTQALFEAMFPVNVGDFTLTLLGETKLGKHGLEGRVKLQRAANPEYGETEEAGLLLTHAWLAATVKLATPRLEGWKKHLLKKLKAEPWRGPMELMPWRLGDAWKLQRDEVKALRAYREQHQPISEQELRNTCLVNMDQMLERFDDVKARFGEIYGLQLPRHVAVAAAFFRSLSGPVGEAVKDTFRPSGLLEWFEDGALSRKMIDGLDPRLDWRFRRDMPEFITVLCGNTDGLHWGLWYDRPDQLPAQIARNYARDSAETWLSPMSTVLGEVLDWRSRDLQDGRESKFQVALIEEYVSALEPMGAWAFEERLPPPPARGAELVGSPGLAERELDPRFTPSEPPREEAAIRALIDEARPDPIAALAVGRLLHWLDSDHCRAEAGTLLINAYRALGYEAFAEIAAVHIAHRDLPSVASFQRG
jgi:Uncharacterised conserved protein (DUF2228)